MTFDTLKYLQESLPGFEFQESDNGSPWMQKIVQAKSRVSIGVRAEINAIKFAVPEAGDRALKEWADEIIRKARQEAMNATGMQHEVERQLREQKERYRRDLEVALQNQRAQFEQKIGASFTAGWEAGRHSALPTRETGETDE